MTEDAKLRGLQAVFERAQQNPPTLGKTERKVMIPTALRPSVDSRGRRRQVVANQGRARQVQIERAKREMVSQAKSELIAKAKEQLRP